MIEDYLAAIGGYAAIAAVHTRRMRGTYDEGQLHATTDIVWERPLTRRVNVHAPGFEYSEGFDGSTWEYNFATRQLKRPTGAAADAGRRGAEFDEPFVDYRRKGYHAELVGPDSLDGRSSYRVRVTLTDGWSKEYYFDRQTHLIVAVRKAMPIHATGPSVVSLSYFSDWQTDSGVLEPHTIVERDLVTGRVMNTLHWDSIEVNGDVSSAELSAPAGLR